MSSSDQKNKQRDREIAENEAERQVVGDVRVSTWAIAVALIAGFASGQSSGRLITIMFGLIAFGLWGVAAHDAYRAARHEEGQAILRGRGFLFLVLGMLGLLLLVVVGSALNVR